MLYRKAAKRVRKLRTALLLTILLLALLIPDAFAAEGAGLRANWTATSAGSMSCEMTFTYNFPIPQDSLTIHLPEGAERIPPVVDLTYRDRESAPTYKGDKVPRFDIVAVTADGQFFYIEFQVAKDASQKRTIASARHSRPAQRRAPCRAA